MNKTSLAKAIGIVLGSVIALISFVLLLAMSKTSTVILFITAIAVIVIAMLWPWIMIIYYNIEDKKKGYWDN
jgi:hypothetical protein